MESSVYEKCCRPIVEIRIVLVDDAFVANHREEANAAIPHVDAYQLMACVGKGPHTAEIYISLRMCPDMNRAVIMGIWEGGTIQKCDYMKDRIQMRARMRIRRNRSKAFFLFSDMIGGMRASSSSSSSSGINGLFTSGGAAIQVTVWSRFHIEFPAYKFQGRGKIHKVSKPKHKTDASFFLKKTQRQVITFQSQKSPRRHGQERQPKPLAETPLEFQRQGQAPFITWKRGTRWRRQETEEIAQQGEGTSIQKSKVRGICKGTWTCFFSSDMITRRRTKGRRSRSPSPRKERSPPKKQEITEAEKAAAK
jgi:hypothetical protein